MSQTEASASEVRRAQLAREIWYEGRERDVAATMAYLRRLQEAGVRKAQRDVKR